MASTPLILGLPLASSAPRFNACEVQRQDLHSEVEAVRDTLILRVAPSLDEQGVDGVLKVGDKGWEATGAIGGVQQTISIVGK